MFIAREEPFTCEHCGNAVTPLGKGTYRDHCPMCLWSKHADRDGPGDRLSECQGMLKPIEIDQDSKKGFVIVYECEKCGQKQRNRAAPDDELTEFMKNRTQK
jgi:DNA-directed RNA polymerase subunit M/transcription elongation factor TFIIS